MSTSSAQVPPTDAARRERCLVVISYYDQRSVASLIDLLESLAQHPAGGDYDVCVVVNEEGARRVDPRGLNEALIVLHRPNSGMNIGAWAHGWRANPGYRDYLFLQDECYAVAAGWLAALRARSAAPGAKRTALALPAGRASSQDSTPPSMASARSLRRTMS